MTHPDRFEDGRVRLEAVARPLIERGVLDPLADRDEDAQLWTDCELCSFVENRLHHQLDPETLTPDQRAAWAEVALAADCTDSRSTRRIDSRSARRFALGARRSECADSSAHA